MDLNRLKSSFVLLIVTCLIAVHSIAQQDKEHVEVALRTIGHQLLLNAEDSSSRVLPIESDHQKFRVRFESEFGFLPSELVASIDSVVRKMEIAKNYRVELENNETKKVVYSYEIDSVQGLDVACATRKQDKAGYDLLFTILDPSFSMKASAAAVPKQNPTDERLLQSVEFISLGILVVIILGIVFYFWRSRKDQEEELSNEIRIGQYLFDKHNMRLIFKTTSIDLTSKETDLLVLLHSSMNETLERDEILKVVWGDEGDYVGRTLDVFISKLRKKFSEDDNVRIINIRGVGYKMMLSDSKV